MFGPIWSSPNRAGVAGEHGEEDEIGGKPVLGLLNHECTKTNSRQGGFLGVSGLPSQILNPIILRSKDVAWTRVVVEKNGARLNRKSLCH